MVHMVKLWNTWSTGSMVCDLVQTHGAQGPWFVPLFKHMEHGSMVHVSVQTRHHKHAGPASR